MKINSYKDLLVWQKSMELVVSVYRVTEDFPKSEIYGLISQMRRCVVSIPSNIAEGSRRGSRKDFRNFVLIAYGSGAELETQLDIATRLEFLDEERSDLIRQSLDEVMKMLNGLMSSLKD